MSMSAGSVFGAELQQQARGSSGVPRKVMLASQRQRLIHGVTLVVADKALSATTISDITDRAGVSKRTFYEHFPDKLACFLAAYDLGATAILADVVDASLTARAEGHDAVAQYRAGTRAYFAFLEREVPYAKTFCLEMLAAGPEASARHRQSRKAFASTVGTWHALNAPDQPTWCPVTDFELEAATGLVYEIACGRIADGHADALVAATDDVVRASLAVLGISLAR